MPTAIAAHRKKDQWGFSDPDSWVRWSKAFADEEADDAMGYNQILNYDAEEDVYKSIICSSDKDLKQVPGRHYDFTKGKGIRDSSACNISCCISFIIGDDYCWSFCI